MQSMKVFGLLAATLLLATSCQVADARQLLATTTQCPIQTCPTNYVRITDSTSACGFYCYTPAKLNCPAAIGAPRICGGTSGKICPALACAYSSTYAVSGPGGCASANATISAYATSISNTTFNSASLVAPIIKQYGCGNSPSGTTPIQIAAANVANAYATTVANTIAQYSTYVCSCCAGPGGGHNYANASVKADVQSVANAQTSAMLNITSAIFASCSTNQDDLLASANGYAEAFARDVQIAIDRVYATAATAPGTCTASGLTTQVQKAVAQATVCTFVNIFAAAQSANPYNANSVAYACATSLSVSGVGAITKCPVNVNCPCDPATYFYNNLGFDGQPAGPFSYDSTSTANPQWSTAGSTGDPNQDPAVITSATVDGPTGPVALGPVDGPNFAVIPGGCSTNYLAADIVVPPCARSISASYVFDCKELGAIYNYNNNDMAKLSISVFDYYTNNQVAYLAVNPQCATTGPKMATNNGQWTPISLGVPQSGRYLVVVQAASSNSVTSDDNGADDTFVGDCTDAFTSKLYIDAISFGP